MDKITTPGQGIEAIKHVAKQVAGKDNYHVLAEGIMIGLSLAYKNRSYAEGLYELTRDRHLDRMGKIEKDVECWCESVGKGMADLHPLGEPHERMPALVDSREHQNNRRG